MIPCIYMVSSSIHDSTISYTIIITAKNVGLYFNHICVYKLVASLWYNIMLKTPRKEVCSDNEYNYIQRRKFLSWLDVNF